MTEDMPLPLGGEEPKRDFTKILDLNRTSLIKDFIGEMEARLRDVQTAQGDLKAICESAAEQEFNPNEVKAMKKIAKLRLKDKKGDAQQELEALQRIGQAADFDVFDWSIVGS